MKAAKGKESNLVQGPQDMVDLKYDDFDSQGTITLGIIIRLPTDNFV